MCKMAAVAALLWAGAAGAAEVPLYLMTMPPLIIDDAARRGIVGDVVLEAMRRAGLQPKVLVEPNSRAMAMVRQQPDTLISALSRTPEREALYTWIAPITTIHRTFYTRAAKVASFSEARALFKHIAVSRDTANAEVLRREGFTPAQMVELNAGESAPRMLAAGRVDAWFNLIPESETLLAQIGGMKLVRSDPLTSSELYLACSKSCNPALVRKLAAALAAMKADGTTRKLMQRYAGEPGYMAE